MKTFFKALLFVFLLLFAFPSNASHITGGDVEYECIGPRIWKVRLTIYRDCTGTSLCGSISSCGQSMYARPNPTLNPVGCVATPSMVNFTVSLIKVEDINKPAKDLCGNSAKNGCTNLGQVTAGPFTPSVEKYIFEGTLNLSTSTLNNTACKYWDVDWELCCRNAGIFNLANSNSQSFRIGATINIFDRTISPYKNNSPILKNEPVIVICANQQIVYNMGGVDSDGDLLTYEITPSMQQSNYTAVYAPPGSPIYPFPLNSNKAPHVNYPQPNGPYVVIDSTTGYVSFNGVNSTSSFISGVMNIRVKQWTNDSNGAPVLVGITHRDVQMFLVNCPANDPPKFSINGGLPNNNNTALKFEVNPGQQLCFTITAKDSNINPFIPGVDTTYISWDSSLVKPGKLTFGPTYPVGSGQPRPREDSWQFCWQVDSSEARDLPYTFTVTAIDKSCPSIGKTTQSVSIQIKNTPSFSSSKAPWLCGRMIYKLYKSKLSTNINAATLQIANSPNDKNFTNGFRTVSLIDINPNAGPSDTLNQPRLMLSDTFNYSAPGKYYIKFYYNNSNPNYVAPFIDSIEINNGMAIAFVSANKPTDICNGDSVLLSASFPQPSFKYQWLKNNVNITNATQSSLWVKTADAYSLKITDTVLSCINNSTPVVIKINPRPTANFYSPNLCIKLQQARTFIDSSSISSGRLTRTWQFDNNINPADTSFTINKASNSFGAVYVKLVSTSNFGCKDSVTKTYYSEPIIFWPSTTPSNSCERDTTMLSVNYMPTYYTFKWYKNNSIIQGANLKQYGTTESGRYSVLCINSNNNCQDTGGVYNLVFNPKPIPVAKLSSNIVCVNNGSITFTDSSSILSGSYTRLWRLGDGTTSTASFGNKVYTSVGSYMLKLILTSDKDCKDSIEQMVYVNSKPNTTIVSNSGTSFCEGKSLILSSTYYPTATYRWYLNNQLINNSDTSNITITSAGNYQLVVDNVGCTDTSSVMSIQVKPSPKVGFTISNDKQCLIGNSFLVTDTTSISSGSFTRTWSWGSNSSSIQSLNLNFPSAGTYPIKLKATSNNGCSDSLTKTVLIVAQPSIGSVTGQIIGLDTIQVYDYSVISQPNYTYTWSVTNGIITVGQGTNIIGVKWSNQGIGIVKLVITNGDGCKDSVTLTVSVVNFAPGVVSFTPQSGGNGTLVTINGYNLLNTSAVLFGNVNAKNFNVVSASVITAVIDTGSTGNVTVVTPYGTALLSGFSFTSGTGIKELESQSYTIFPNPVNSEIIIESNKNLHTSCFELLDLTGNVIISSICDSPTNRLTIDVKTLSPAIYLLRVTSQGQTSTVKVVKH